MDGFRFTDHTCADFGDRIEVYKVWYALRQNRFKKVYDWKIYKDTDDVSQMPEHVLIDTENLDFIRMLFKEGKNVSWYNPSISRFAKYFAQFDFEHLFLHLFSCHDLVYPTGQVLPEKDEFGNYAFDFDNGTKGNKYRVIKWARKIGYHRKALDERVNKVGLFKRQHYDRVVKGIRCSFIPRIGGHYLLWYFNMLSITYMICNKSIAANVKTKGALKE